MTSEPEVSKRCATCGEVKPVSLFSKNKNQRDGFQTRCKACIRLENQGYREKNGDHIRAKQREQYHANSEAILERQRAHRKANAETIRQRRHEYCITHTDIIRERNRRYRTKNADAIQERNEAYRIANAHITEKYCMKCGLIKPLTSFSRSEDKKDGYKTRCKECTSSPSDRSAYRKANADAIREYQRRYRAENADMVRDKKRQYHQNNPDIHRASRHRRRALIRNNGGTFTVAELIAMRAAQNGVCAYCQRWYNPQVLTIDHVNPLHYGGRHEAANIVLACGKCNRSKGARTPEEWVDRWYLR